jgi:pyruvate dehydrogenase E2 component (dihydrolipoamide acetyltransferase)
MADVTMPRLSDTMEEGKILRWLKHEGDQVETGELLVEVETDKADMEVESTASGVLRQVKLAEGQTAAVGAVIAVIEAGGSAAATPSAGNGKAAPEEAPRESASQKAAPEAASRSSAQPKAAPAEPPASAPGRSAPASRAASSSAASGARAAAPAAAAPHATAPRSGDVKASPLARSLADELGVDLSSVRGTGPAGRITRRDVEEAQARAAKGGAPAAKPAAPRAAASDARAQENAPPKPAATRGEDRQPPAAEQGETAKSPAHTPQAAGEATAGVRRVALSKMRASIAKRMTESKREAPHFYLTTVVDMDEAVRLRAQLKALEVEPSVTYNHMVLKACADALAAFPEVNARFAGDAIELLEEINVGIATAVDDGLLVPVLSGANRLDLLSLAAQARAFAEKAESGRFTSADLSGATFSVSNLGMFDVDSFSAVLNPPQAAILAVGSVKQRPVVHDGALAVGWTMALTLSCDHRVIDGARGGRFLADVKRRLENPAALMLPAGGGA